MTACPYVHMFVATRDLLSSYPIYPTNNSCKTDVDKLWVCTSHRDTVGQVKFCQSQPPTQHPCSPILEAMSQLVQDFQRLKTENQQLWSENERLQLKNEAAKNKEITYRKERDRQDQDRLDRLMLHEA